MSRSFIHSLVPAHFPGYLRALNAVEFKTSLLNIGDDCDVGYWWSTIRGIARFPRACAMSK